MFPRILKNICKSQFVVESETLIVHVCLLANIFLACVGLLLPFIGVLPPSTVDLWNSLKPSEEMCFASYQHPRWMKQKHNRKLVLVFKKYANIQLINHTTCQAFCLVGPRSRRRGGKGNGSLTFLAGGMVMVEAGEQREGADTAGGHGNTGTCSFLFHLLFLMQLSNVFLLPFVKAVHNISIFNMSVYSILQRTYR